MKTYADGDLLVVNDDDRVLHDMVMSNKVRK